MLPYTLKGLDPTFCIGVNLYLSICCFLECLDLRQMQAMMDTHTPTAVTETKQLLEYWQLKGRRK